MKMTLRNAGLLAATLWAAACAREAARIEVKPSPVALESTNAVMLSVQVFDSNDKPIEPPPATTWTSQDAAVATVDASGKVAAVKSGTTTIRAQVGAVTKDVPVTVTLMKEIRVPETVSVAAGVSQPLAAVVVDDAGQPVAKPVTWTSSDPNVAAFDAATGSVVAKAAGKAQLTATVGTLSKTVEVTVTEPAPAEPTPENPN